MRQIKFRAWHFKVGKMFSAEQMAADQLTLLTTGQFINVSGVHTRLSSIIPRDVMMPLEFTGLRDKNGQDIYEGDILDFGSYIGAISDGTRCLHKVVYEDNQGGFRTIELISPEKGTFPMDHYCVVVGNIYENPELLNLPVDATH
ncbi:YopX family protein [Spirosoma foliorum]|uniref:YopX protein domain-containing protein n=1 Tax=Spirosoma foliorum TaxID=2710596 RepID=A0A7G5H5K1_9BACT|nr:YopX family protein [Spirosoma foliorum]QMW06393.1 hypothetical protein H3H32_16620 [Spirosoma foliorum]